MPGKVLGFAIHRNGIGAEMMKNQFQIEPGNIQSTYDYCSIMHYSSTAFSKNNLPTIECALSGLSVPCPSCFGNRTDFSEKDKEGIDKFYSNVSRFPCKTDFPIPNSQQMQLSGTYPSASQAAIAAFQRSSLLATKEKVVGAYPNFHEARQGNNIVGGTIFLKYAASRFVLKIRSDFDVKFYFQKFLLEDFLK